MGERGDVYVLDELMIGLYFVDVDKIFGLFD